MKASLFLLPALLGAAPLVAQLAPAVKLAEVVVSPSRFGVADVTTMAAVGLTAGELEVLPQVGDDLFRSIARLPGLSTDDVSARFWVRGAPQSEVRLRLDGADLLEPFHLKDVDGALSIVDPAAIRWLDLATGGFQVEHGDRLAGVLTMETKSDRRALTALNLSLTGVGGLRQGVFAGGRGRWLATARRGYPDIALKASGRDDDISPRYYDLMGKVEYDAAPGHTLSFHALRAGDGLRYERTNSPSLSSGYGSNHVWGRWRGELSGGLRGEAVLAWNRLTWSRQGSGRQDGFPFSLTDHRELDLVSLRNDWTWQTGESAVWRTGFEAAEGAADYDYALSRQRTVVSGFTQGVATDRTVVRLEPEGANAAAFAAVKFRVVGPLVAEPGLRWERAGHVGGATLTPRLNAALTLGATVIRAAWGDYAQRQGLHELSVSDGERVFGRIERAEHRVIGLERALGPRVALRLEAYQRLTSRVRPRWENIDNAYDLFPEAQSDRVRVAPAKARAEGVEFLLSSRGTGALQWNVSHAIARTEERVAGRWVPRRRDQRHAFYADVTYVLNPRWQFSAAWHYHTGWPTTDVVYSLAPLANNRRVLVSANGEPYGLRLPDYHRLDLRVTRRFQTARGEVRTYLDLFNVYDRLNLLGYDHQVSVSGGTVTSRRKPREQLPFLPSIGLSWEF